MTIKQFQGNASRGKEFSLRHALQQAMQSLVELTPLQKRIAEKSQSLSRVVNHGRIVLLTHVTDKENLKVWQIYNGNFHFL